MAVSSIRRKRAFVWIPPTSTAAYKLTITPSTGGSEVDITSNVHMIEVEDGVTSVIGRFSFELYDPAQTYKGVWSNMDIIKYYSDYAATATTLRFRARIENINYSDNKIKVTGRNEALFFMDITVTKKYTNQKGNVILKALIDAYNPGGFTYTNVDEFTDTMVVNWYQKPFWDCVKEIAQAMNADIYIDSVLDFHMFTVGSRENTGEAIVHDYNELEVEDFSEDSSFVVNRVIVYGAEVDGIQVLATAEDSDSQTTYGVREEIINDSNFTDETQAQDYADYVLSNKKDPPQIGNVKGVLLASIQPGEKIHLSSPFNNINPALYDILSYKHKIDLNRGLTTTVTVTRNRGSSVTSWQR